MSGPVTLGFGGGPVAGLVRSDAGALICRGGETSVVRRARIEELDGGSGWRATDGAELDVGLEPLGEPATFSDGTREWLCRARGRAGGASVDSLGHAVLEPRPPRDWKRVAFGRGVAAWLSEELAVAVRARRPARAKNHAAEELGGFVLRGSPPVPNPIEDPRLSTSYAGAGAQPPSVPRRAGLELWETEESEYPLRLAGEAVGAGELELNGGGRLRSAFFVWRSTGRVGAGRYDIIVPVD